MIGGQLFGEFPSSTYEEWRQVAEKTLKGAPFEKKLISKTYEEIDLQPIYWQEDVAGLPHVASLPGFPPFVRGSEVSGYLVKPWKVSQELACGEPVLLNRAARSALKQGQTELNILLDRASLAGLDADEADSGDVGREGVSVSGVDDIARVLDGIDVERIPIYIQAGLMALPVTALLAAFMRQQGKSTEKLRGCIGLDPLGALARRGTLPGSLKGAYDTMAWLTAWVREHAPQLQTIVVQGQPYHDGGSSAVQELAFAVATAVEYVSEMQARGISVADVARRIRFSFSAGSGFFMEIAKLRAARLVWAEVINAFGGNEDAKKLFMHVCTSAWNKTIYDPYVNLLRTTTEAFAGVMGGADSLHVATFDQAIRPADDFSRRIARNIQIILNEECKFTIPVDPSGGSWCIEKLTDSIARQAWRLFQEIEARGGMFKALQEGFPQAQVAQTAAKRRSNIAQRKDIFVGTNMYPNLNEMPLVVHPVDHEAIQREQSAHLADYRLSVDQARCRLALERLARARESTPESVVEAAIEAALSGATLGGLARALRTAAAAAPAVGAVQIHRGAEIFESLRAASEAYKERTGSLPTVFLANMGPIPQHKARADFTTGFFEVGGFAVLKNDGFPTVEEAALAAVDSKALIVVICSTDDTYPELVGPLTKLIKEDRPDTTVILAGYPADYVDAFREAGVDDFVHIRANCYELLLNLMKQRGVV